MKPLLCLLSCAWFAGLVQNLPADRSANSDPAVTRKVEAEYSPEARAAKLQGTVYLYVEVSPEGTPANVRVMHGLGLGLDEKAVEAVKQWQFKPGTKDGKPETVLRAVEVRFRLPDAGGWRVRQAAYSIGGKAPEVLVKPVLSRYAPPDSASCPAEGGTATVSVTIGSDGSPLDVEPKRPAGPIGQAAAKAIASWLFLPGLADGKPRGAKAIIEFECGGADSADSGYPVFRVGGGVTAPIVVFKPEPEYSEVARRAKRQGEVVLSAVIDSTGHPTQIHVTKPLGLGLDEQAMSAVSQWRFRPGAKEGTPVSILAQVAVNFKLLDPPNSEPVLVYKPAVEYSPEAEAAKLQGTAYLYLEVSPEGKTENVQVMHGLGLGLDGKAVDAVKRWQFKPGMKDGQPERVALAVKVGFLLVDNGPWRIYQAAYTVASRRDEVLVKPVLTRYASPDPAACPADGGAAIVELSIGEDGRPRNVKAQRPSDPVGEAAAKTVGSWQFQPGQAGGKPASATASIEFECGRYPGAAPDSSVYTPGNEVTSPLPVLKPEPVYSQEARDAKFQGTVWLRLVVDPTGRPSRLRVVKMAGLGLDEKALEAASQWRFQPGTKDGRPVSVQTQVEVAFHLTE
jgi:TonB family protein